MIYSDCPVFGGADAVATAILRDETLSRSADLTFAYRDHPRFAEGVARHTRPALARLPVRLPERHDWLKDSTGVLARALFRLADYAVFLYDTARLTAAFRTVRPDLVHVNDGGYPGAMGCRAAALAARLAGARKVVFVVHNQTLPLRLPWEALEWLIDRVVGSCVDLFVTASLSSQDSLCRRGFDRALMRVIPDGVPAPGPRRPARKVREELRLPLDEPVFAMTAFFESRKGHRTLLEALARLGPRAPHVLLVGDGPEKEVIQDLTRKMGLESHLHFTGFRADYLDLIAACDGLILPSLGSEDMPLVILDAMALGKPVVASRLAGIPEEVEDGRTGLLAAPGDARGLADALSRLTEDAALRSSLGAEGLARFQERFEIGLMAGRYRGLYAGLLGSAGAAPAEAVRP